MIHYHGTPVGGSREQATKFLKGRHAMVSFARDEDLAVAADVCQSFAIDNGAFTTWKQGNKFDPNEFTDWVGNNWAKHPGFDWALIPDVIDGTEEENDLLINRWPFEIRGCPVWHLHESLDRLKKLCGLIQFRAVAFGSSGKWRTPGTDAWKTRMGEAFDAICDSDGRPPCRLHGLRMLASDIVCRFPFSSADSTNAVRNSSLYGRYGCYCPPERSQRAENNARIIEAINSPPVWKRTNLQLSLDELWG